MQVDQALRALAQLKEAAPPTTSARLNDMIALIRDLEAENADLQRQLAGYSFNDLLAPAFAVFRAELDSIREQSEALRTGKLNGRATAQADSLQAISDRSANALKLISSMEQVAVIRGGRLQIEPLVFSGLDLLADTWQIHHEAAEARQQNIHVYADDPLPLVLGDYRYILDVLCDLLDNAIHYSLPGGQLRMTAENLGTHVLFSIADDGIGLTPEELDQIGTPFWRAVRQPLVREYPGAGLRLHIAQALLKLHESELLFSSEPGAGSTFSFALPVG
jgi:signal transduction histidine kinase